MTVDSTYRLLEAQHLLKELWIDRNWFQPNEDNVKTQHGWSCIARAKKEWSARARGSGIGMEAIPT